jgi:hypothetical protein
VPFSFVVSGSKICQRPLRKIIYSNWLLIYYERSTSERLLSPLYLLVNIPGALAWISTIRGYFLFVAITINPNDDVPIAIIHFYAWCLCWLFTNKNHRFVLLKTSIRAEQVVNYRGSSACLELLKSKRRPHWSVVGWY